ILTEVVFCIVGIMLGFSITKMDISIVMCGVGFVALAGLVVRNGILLVEFTDLLIKQGTPLYAAVVEAGKTRMTPVLLTAIATILGLIPLAVGFNIDFATLFTEFNPHIFFGGDSVSFWGPLSWTMIFGLSFATFLTLILVPVLYYSTTIIGETFSHDKMFRNIFSFNGRIRRTEYWISQLTAIVVFLIFKLWILPASIGSGTQVFAQALNIITVLVMVWIMIAQSAKRCHDIGKEGWWQLVIFWNLILFVKDSDKEANEYGESPKKRVTKMKEELVVA
ncbi:MAG TPA: efflux RND transporter permease subunit, partial [Bacteroidia bacterium]|nr:efflux RND transporter permease subunit [Bacteroidia bacterium]